MIIGVFRACNRPQLPPVPGAPARGPRRRDGPGAAAQDEATKRAERADLGGGAYSKCRDWRASGAVGYRFPASCLKVLLL